MTYIHELPDPRPTGVGDRIALFRGIDGVEKSQLDRTGDPSARDGYVRPVGGFGRPDDFAMLPLVGEAGQHVLTVYRSRFKSFSLSRDVAVGYATHGGTQRGWVVTAELGVIGGTKITNHPPMMLFGDDGTWWADPRSVPQLEGQSTEDWAEIRVRSRWDHELLLGGPEARVDGITPVKASDCPKDWMSWLDYLRKMRRGLGIG
jgi:hypothetical protein